MKLFRRQFLNLVARAVALPALSRTSWALDYPTRSVRIVVGFPAGTSSDIVARLIAQWLSERLGQQFVVENRPGAGTNVATETVVQASPDGYSLVWVTQTNAINGTLYHSLKFNFIQDIQPVAGVIRVPTVMMVNPSVPAKTVPGSLPCQGQSGQDQHVLAGMGAPTMSSGLSRCGGRRLIHVYRGS